MVIFHSFLYVYQRVDFVVLGGAPAVIRTHPFQLLEKLAAAYGRLGWNIGTWQQWVEPKRHG
jgi:hypothetical protein